MRRSLEHTVELDHKAFTAARSIMASAELQQVRLSRFHFSSNLDEARNKEADLSSSRRFSWKTDGSKLVIFFDLAIKGHQEDVTIVEVSAKIEATYEIPKESELSEFAIRSFAKSNGMLNVWPFWREYVQAATQRAGLAPLTLPLFRVVHKSKPTSKPLLASEPANP